MIPQRNFSTRLFGCFFTSLLLWTCQNNTPVDNSVLTETLIRDSTKRITAMPGLGKAYGARFTLIKWQGLVKINNTNPYNGLKFNGLSGIKFNKTSDFLLVTVPENTSYLITPADYVRNPSDASFCIGKNCDPIITNNMMIYSSHVNIKIIERNEFTVIDWKGAIKINSLNAYQGQKFTGTPNISFQKNSDFLLVKNDKEACFFIHPESYNTNAPNGVPCNPDICQPVLLEARFATSDQMKMYEAYKDPGIKVTPAGEKDPEKRVTVTPGQLPVGEEKKVIINPAQLPAETKVETKQTPKVQQMKKIGSIRQ